MSVGIVILLLKLIPEKLVYNGEKILTPRNSTFGSQIRVIRKNYQYFDILKVAPATFLLVCFLNVNESTCQNRKNVFYFTSKALFILEQIKF